MDVMTLPTDRAPWYVRRSSGLLQALLARGIPVGPNALLTVTGRTSGRPRTTPVAIIEVDGRRWVWSPWGDVHWVRNLRASGQATIERRGRQETVRATELDEPERAWFFREILTPLARSMRGGVWFIRVVDGVDLGDPEAVAEGRRVFELHPA